LRNLEPLSRVMAEAYGDAAAEKVGLPKLESSVKPVADVVDVDYSLAGCSPKTEQIVELLGALHAGAPVDQPRKNLCDECHREKKLLLTHSQDFVSDNVYALMELDRIDPDACFIEQGVLCMGAVTREGCGARCTAANSPCRGCSGPSRLDFEQGAKAIDALAALLPAGAIMYMEDLIGASYRFSLPVSVFPEALHKEEAEQDA
jgi:F420-non-reducing hydrogenase small subunit